MMCIITYVQIFGGLAPQKFEKAKTLKIWCNFGQLSNLTSNILGTNWNIENQKQTLWTAILPGFTEKI